MDPGGQGEVGCEFADRLDRAVTEVLRATSRPEPQGGWKFNSLLRDGERLGKRQSDTESCSGLIELGGSV